MPSQESKQDHPGVKIPPPLCYFVFLVLGIVLNSDWINGSLGSVEQLVSGGVLLGIGLLVTIPEAFHHKKAGTNVEPWKPTTTILDTGLYAYSRNPIYLGMTLAYLGIALASWSLGMLFLLPLCLGVMHFQVIAREEAYLEDKFGDEYLSYKSRVRRWI